MKSRLPTCQKAHVIKKMKDHSFIQAISIAPLQVHYYSETPPTQHRCGSEFHAEVPQATASKGLAQGSYMAARAGVEPTTLQTMSHRAPPVFFIWNIDETVKRTNIITHPMFLFSLLS